MGVPVNTVPVGGRLSLFVDHWVKITQDHFILSVVRQGFLISVQNNFPGVLREVTVPPRDPRVHVAICEEIQELIQKNAIVQIDDFPLLCLSPIFVIPKKTGDLRVILNLKKINVFIPVQHFRMETLNVILPELRPQDWAVSLDLKDAYLHVPIHPQSRRLLGFRFQGKTYVYKVLPFGLKDSPWVFSRLVATVIAHLRLQGIRIFYYLDDWLIVAESQSVLQSHLRTTLQLVQNLGFIVNLKKSVFTPQKMPVYLGASLDIRRLIARPVEPRVLVLQSLIQELVASPTVPALLWQKVLGHLASLVDLVPNCRLLMRPLQLHFLRFFTPLLDSQSKLIPMSPEIKVLCAAWASPVRLLEGKPFSPPPPLPGTDLRCFPVRLGRDSSASPSLRHVVPGGFLGPHQFSRTQGSIPGLEVSRRSCCRSVTSDSFRQHNSRVLHQLSGRNSLPLSLPVSYRAVGVVHSEGDLPFGRSHSGERQPGGGLPVQREVPSIGVDSQSFDFSSDLSGDCPSAGDRPVCVHPQFSASQVLCPLPGSSSLESGRTLLPVVRPSTVRLPTLFDPPHSLGEDRPGGSGRGSGGPLLASETMVPEVVIASGGTSQSSSSVEGPCLPTHVSSSASETRKPPSHTLAAFREKGKQAGLSDRAAEFTAEALRESTRASYDSKLELFFKWCNDFTCDPYSASLGQVADFLIYLFDKGLAISTIRGYRSAIASCHRGFQDGSSISESSILSNLCKSFFLKRPPEKTLLPAWSLPVVLRALAEAPFEPLHKISLHCLAIKTAFLVAIASGQRVSALHALSIEPGHVRWEPAGVRLVPRPNFIAKNQSPSSQPVEIFLPSMSSFSSVEADKVWCPVRALKWYLDRTKSKRSSTSLFVSSIAPFKAISKASISRWLVECISMAGPDALVSGRFRAHDTRSVSSSWALFNGASLKDIQQAAYWSSPNTFISCYLKDVLAAEASFGSAVLRSSSGSRSTSTASRVPVVSM